MQNMMSSTKEDGFLVLYILYLEILPSQYIQDTDC